MRGEGTYEKEVRHHLFIDGSGPQAERLNDEGRCVVSAMRFRCSSARIQNLSSEGFQADGRIHVVQDMIGEGLPVVYTFATSTIP